MELTGSVVAEKLLSNWHDNVRQFTKIFPKDYKRVLAVIKKARETGVPEDEAVMASING
jgi:glutamate synthase domain-containing protein 3